MSFTDDDKAVIKVIVIDELEDYISGGICDIKMDNQEDDMKRFEKRLTGVDRKSWAIIMLLIANLVGVAVKAWSA